MANVLVVEDEPGIALGLEDTLKLEGHHVEVLGNGAAAIRRATETAFDLILLDVMLPGKSGFDVCRELREAGYDAPIIFLSARTQEEDRVSGLDLGANDYVTKPFSPKELVARVRGLLRFVETSREDRRRFEHEVEAAARVQQQLLPSVWPVVAGVDYDGACRPALGVSGDYYDCFVLPSGRLALLVADVCGKGMPAALVAASLHAAVHAYAPALDRRCGALLARLNRMLYETTAVDRYVTVFYAVYDPVDRTLTWSNAGHCPPLWFDEGERVTRLDSLLMPAGLASACPALERTISLAPGDLLLVYSDGVSEARDPRGEEFGESRMLDVIRKNRHLPASRVCKSLLDVVMSFCDGQRRDDVTVLAARFS